MLHNACLARVESLYTSCFTCILRCDKMLHKGSKVFYSFSYFTPPYDHFIINLNLTPHTLTTAIFNKFLSYSIKKYNFILIFSFYINYFLIICYCILQAYYRYIISYLLNNFYIFCKKFCLNT